jgi:hypothetical protein
MEDLLVDYGSGNLDSDDVKLAFGKGINNILKVTSAFLIVCIQITPKNVVLIVDNLCQYK